MILRIVFSLYPLLFGISPTLSLYAGNADRVGLIELVRTLAVALAGSGCLLVLARAVFKDKVKAGVYVSVFLLVFFSYQTTMDSLARRAVFGFVFGRHRYVYGVYVLFLAALFVAFLRSRRDFTALSRFFATMGVFLVLTPLAKIGFGALAIGPADIGAAKWAKTLAAEQDRARETALSAPQNRPDIYYIILDCYMREDVLKEYYHCDISDFTGDLEEMGFRIAKSSYSNYPCTYMSLSSSLNFDYLDNLQNAVGRDLNTGMFRRLIADNKICRVLGELGYEIVFFPSGWDVTADSRCADQVIPTTRTNLSQFERIQIERSMLKILTVGVREQRTRVQRTFDLLADIPKNEKPTFTLAHVVCPHPPYVFDKEGRLPALASVPERELDDRVEAKLYAEQLLYVSKLTKEAVQEILRQSPDAVIVLQGDHGIFLTHVDANAASDAAWQSLPTDSRDRFADCAAGIINAYRFPGAEQAIYDDISPVNTFRVMLNDLFDTRYDLLPDRTFLHGKSRLTAPESLDELVEWKKAD